MKFGTFSITKNLGWKNSTYFKKSIKSRKVKALLVNARNANCLTGVRGFNSLKEIAEEYCFLFNLEKIYK